jgi:hypothetical protein
MMPFPPYLPLTVRGIVFSFLAGCYPVHNFKEKYHDTVEYVRFTIICGIFRFILCHRPLGFHPFKWGFRSGSGLWWVANSHKADV